MSSNWLGGIGPFGWTIVILTIAIVAAGIVASAVRVRRGVAIALLVAAVVPQFIAFGETVVGMRSSFEVIETLKAPTPRDLSGAVHQSVRVTTLALVGTFVCGVTGLAALLRARKPEAAPSQPAA